MPTPMRTMLNHIAAMICGMPFSGSVTLINNDLTKATDEEIIHQIYTNLRNVNAMADESNSQRDLELDRLKELESDVAAMRRLLKG